MTAFRWALIAIASAVACGACLVVYAAGVAAPVLALGAGVAAGGMVLWCLDKSSRS
jgi:hypothetical protein